VLLLRIHSVVEEREDLVFSHSRPAEKSQERGGRNRDSTRIWTISISRNVQSHVTIDDR
jgi:hypothetical protein